MSYSVSHGRSHTAHHQPGSADRDSATDSRTTPAPVDPFFRRPLITSSARDSNGELRACASSEGWWDGGPQWFAAERAKWRKWYKLGGE